MRQNIIAFVVRSPFRIVLCIGLILFFVLLSRGLNYGPLHYDVTVTRAWFDGFGLNGFSQKFFEVNQRHLLVGPLSTVAYMLFGKNDLPYNIIFHLSRVVEGAFLAGLVYQLTKRRLLSICAGLSLILTFIRVPQLYQENNWFVEPSLGLLLASSYFYVVSFKVTYRKWLWVAVSATLYILSIFIYESGIAWVAVNLMLGWLLRPNVSWYRRALLTLRDCLIPILAGSIIVYLIVFVFVPWQGLAPDSSTGSPLRLIPLLGNALAYPALVFNSVNELINDGYTLLLALLALIAIAVAVLASRVSRSNVETQSPRDYVVLLALSLVMIFSSIVVGTSNKGINIDYMDRITFGRAAGISLLYVTLIFAACSLLRSRWREMIATICVALLCASGFAYIWMYQDVAFRSRAEIDRIANAVVEVRKLIYLPAHLVIITEPNWVGSKIFDASDILLTEIQQRLYQLNEPATIDIVKTGMSPDYEPVPGTCLQPNGIQPGGLCLDKTSVVNSRFSIPSVSPYDDIVVTKWDSEKGILTILKSVSVDTLKSQGYNIFTIDRQYLETNLSRVSVPVP